MRRFVFAILVSSLFLVPIFVAVPVGGHSGILLSAWTSTPPTIDGTINVATEWAMADTESFMIGSDYLGTLYVMNDDTNLYLAVEIADDDFGSIYDTSDQIHFFFDNDHDGLGPETGDDSILCFSWSFISFDEFWNSSQSYWAWDAQDGGTHDGEVAATGNGTHNFFEFSHPLDSADDTHDFSLASGDRVGFMMRYMDNTTWVGYWPSDADPYGSPSNWHDIMVTFPNSIYQGDLVLTDNDVFVIENETFIINGSIRVTENATLELKDAVINFTQKSDNDHGILFYSGNTKLKADNVTIISTYDTFMNLQTNCSANVNDLHGPVSIWLELFKANLNMSNSEVHWYFGSDSNVTISNCEIEDIESWGDDISISDSNVGPCSVVSSSIMTHNSTIEDIDAMGEASIFVLGNLTVNGSVSLYGNATLHLEDAFVELSQIHDEEFNMTFNDYSNLQAINSEVNSDYVFIVYFYENSSATVDQLSMPVTLARLYAFDTSILDLNAFTSRYLRAFNSSVVDLSNSAPYYLRSYDTSEFHISNSTIIKQYSFNTSSVVVSQTDYVIDFRTYDSSGLNATDSTIGTLYTYDNSTVWLLNSTYDSCGIYDQSKVYVNWYLDAHIIDSIDQDVPSANVIATYPNATQADLKLTDVDGWTRFTLLEKMMNATGEYPVGNYTVEATYEIYSNSTTVNMTDNQIITLRLSDFIIPEYSYMFHILFLVIQTSLFVALYRKRRADKT